MHSFLFKYPLKNISVNRIDFSDYSNVMSSLRLRRSLRFARQPLLNFRDWLSDFSLAIFTELCRPRYNNKTLSTVFDGKLKMSKILTTLTVSY